MFRTKSSFTKSLLLLSLLAAAGLFIGNLHAQTTTFSGFVIFGDSLSDVGNFANTTDDEYDIRYPSTDFNYADGRFTDSSGTSPAAQAYMGVWHEQLAKLFLGLKPATQSVDGSGTDYAFGDAETGDGQRSISVTTDVTIHVDNMARQVTTYLSSHTPDPTALFIVWGGSNDLFDNDSASNVTTAATNVTGLIQRLAEAGATQFLVPNIAPLGLTPNYNSGDAATAAAITQAASDFRDQLNADLDALETTLANEGRTVKIYRLDIFGLFQRLIASSGADYGFVNITDSAQGQGVKADQYLFWDDVHPTTYGHFQIAAEAYTLLTGVPVVEVERLDAHIDRNAGDVGEFLLTRTGPDVSSEFQVPYSLSGAAVSGTDYTALKGERKMKAGKRTVMIGVHPTGSSASADSVKIKLTLDAAAAYTLPPVPTATINIDSH